MLQEMYEVYNPTTGSIFTNFVLRSPLEKVWAMSELVKLFVACDKVCDMIILCSAMRLT